MKITIEHNEFQHTVDFPLGQYSARDFMSGVSVVTTVLAIASTIAVSQADSGDIAVPVYFMLAVFALSVLTAFFSWWFHLFHHAFYWEEVPIRYEGDAVETRQTPRMRSLEKTELSEEPLPLDVIEKIHPYLAYKGTSIDDMYPIERMLTMEQAESLYDFPYTPESRMAFDRLPYDVRFAINKKIEFMRGYAKGVRDGLGKGKSE